MRIGTMVRRAPIAAALLAGMLIGPSLPAGRAWAQPLLRIDFENQTPGQTVGTGGAAMGEPDWFNGLCAAVIRNDVSGSLSLEMADRDTLPFPGMVRCDVPDPTPGPDDVLVFALDFFPREVDDAFVLVTEPAVDDAATFQFCKFLLRAGGYLAVTDQAHPDPVDVGTYTAGDAHHLALIFHPAAGTYDVRLDGRAVLTGRSPGATDLVPGSLWLGIEGDADVLGVVDFDDIVVSGEIVAARAVTWGDIKARYR